MISRCEGEDSNSDPAHGVIEAREPSPEWALAPVRFAEDFFP